MLSRCKQLSESLFEQNNSTRETPLHWAVSCNEQETAERLIHEMKKISAKADKSENPFRQMNQTITTDDVQAARCAELLDIRSKAGHTPFFVAMVRGHLEIATLLLKDKMSSIDYEDEENDTPLHWAVILDKPDSVSFLIEKGAQLSAINRNQNSPLMLACLDSNLAIIKLLLQSEQQQQLEIVN